MTLIEAIADEIPLIAGSKEPVDLIGDLIAHFPKATGKEITDGIGLCKSRIAARLEFSLPAWRATTRAEMVAAALTLPHLLAMEGIQMHRTTAMIFCFKIAPDLTLRDYLDGEELSRHLTSALIGEGCTDKRALRLAGREHDD